MKKMFFNSIALASIMCMLLWCVPALAKAPSSGLYGSTENGIPSFARSGNSSIAEIQAEEKLEVVDEYITEEVFTPADICGDAPCSSISIPRDECELCGFEQEGLASWYGKNLHGRITASGELFDMNSMTAAHRDIPFGTIVEVFDTLKGLAVTVRINDRGPFINGRVINLSRLAAEKIDLIEDGIAEVKIKIVNIEN